MVTGKLYHYCYNYITVIKRMGAQNITPHQDINDILAMLSSGLTNILGDNLVGLYLTGSLTYGDFNLGSSDIDFLAILNRKLISKELEQIKDIHWTIGEKYPTWAYRIEGSYITKDMLKSTEPPKEARPYINGGKFWEPEPHYGNEWALNLYTLREQGIELVGPSPKTLIDPIDIGVVRAASKKDLY